MEDASLAYQRAQMKLLGENAAVTALVADRIHDLVPQGTPKPYVKIGDDVAMGDPADCLERSVVLSSRIHVYSGAPGKAPAKRIGGAIVDALDGADLDAGPDWRVVEVSYVRSAWFDEPDGLTTHGVIEHRVMLDPA